MMYSFCRTQWLCSHCKNMYNNDLIEQSLIDVVQKRSLSYLLQDLICTKCKGVSWRVEFNYRSVVVNSQ